MHKRTLKKKRGVAAAPSSRRPAFALGSIREVENEDGPALHKLPDGCLQQIAGFLTVREVLALSRTGARLMRSLENAPCWQRFACAHFNNAVLRRSTGKLLGGSSLVESNSGQRKEQGMALYGSLTFRQQYLLQMRLCGYERYSPTKVRERKPLRLLRHGPRILADTAFFMTLPALLSWLPFFGLLLLCFAADAWRELQQPPNNDSAARNPVATAGPLIPSSWWTAVYACGGLLAALSACLTAGFFGYVVACSTDATQHAQASLSPLLRSLAASWEAVSWVVGCTRSRVRNPRLVMRNRPVVATPHRAGRSPWSAFGLLHAGHGLGPSTSALFAVLSRSFPLLPLPQPEPSRDREAAATVARSRGQAAFHALVGRGTAAWRKLAAAAMLAMATLLAVVTVLHRRFGEQQPAVWSLPATALLLLTLLCGSGVVAAALSPSCWASWGAVVGESQAQKVAAAEVARRAVVAEQAFGNGFETCTAGRKNLLQRAEQAFSAAATSALTTDSKDTHVTVACGLETLLHAHSRSPPPPQHSMLRRDEDWSLERVTVARAPPSFAADYIRDMLRAPVCLAILLFLSVYPLMFQLRDRVLSAPALAPVPLRTAERSIAPVDPIHLSDISSEDWWQLTVGAGAAGLPLSRLGVPPPSLQQPASASGQGRDGWTFVQGEWPSLEDQMVLARAFALERWRSNCSWSTPLLLWQAVATADGDRDGAFRVNYEGLQREALPADLHRVLAWTPNLATLGLSTLPFRALRRMCRARFFSQAVFGRWTQSMTGSKLSELYKQLLQQHATSALSAQCSTTLGNFPSCRDTHLAAINTTEDGHANAVVPQPAGAWTRILGTVAAAYDTVTAPVAVDQTVPAPVSQVPAWDNLVWHIGQPAEIGTPTAALNNTSSCTSVQRAVCDLCGVAALAGNSSATVRCLTSVGHNFTMLLDKPAEVSSAEVIEGPSGPAVRRWKRSLASAWEVAAKVKAVIWLAIESSLDMGTFLLGVLRAVLLDAHTGVTTPLGTVSQNSDAAISSLKWFGAGFWDLLSPIPIIRWLWQVGVAGRVLLAACQLGGMAIVGNNWARGRPMRALQQACFPGGFLVGAVIIGCSALLRLLTYGIVRLLWALLYSDGLLRSILPSWLDRVASSPLPGLLPVLVFYLSQGHLAGQVQDIFLHPDTSMAIALLRARRPDGAVAAGRPRNTDPSANTTAAHIPCRAPLWAYFLLAARKLVVASLLGVLVRQTIGAFAVPLLLRIPWIVYALPALLYFAGVGLLGITCVIATFHHTLHFWPQGNLRRLTGRGGEVAWGLLNPDGTLAGATPIWFGALPRDENVNVLDE